MSDAGDTEGPTLSPCIPPAAVLSLLSSGTKKTDLLALAKQVGVAPGRMGKSALARTVAERLLRGSTRNVGRIFASPHVEEVRMSDRGGDAMFVVAGRLWQEALGTQDPVGPQAVRNYVASKLSPHDLKHAHDTQAGSWLDRARYYAPNMSLGDLRSAVRGRAAYTGDEIALRRIQQKIGVRLVVFSSDYARCYASDFGAPFPHGVAFLVYDMPRRAWGYLSVRGRTLQSPGALGSDPAAREILLVHREMCGAR